MGFLFRLVFVALIGVGGWVVGSLYPAPHELLERINAQAMEQRVRTDLSRVDWEGMRALMSPEEFERMSGEASRLAAAAGEMIEVEHEFDASVDRGEALTPTAPPPPRAPQASGAFEASLPLCPRMTISNGPANDGAGRVARYAPLVNVNNVRLAVNPTHGACLSSGFGPRSGRLHKGLDFHADTGGPILAAGDGVIVEMKYRDDYGNMLLIDHGGGVYTRYAHLSTFAPDLAVGGRVTAGQQIGLMGNTASYAIPIHLHYEVLLGDYGNPRGSFGLTPHSPFEYPAAT
jgi:murein DD-endopeptidase MepM/ murein hydrolase activator NlpD